MSFLKAIPLRLKTLIFTFQRNGPVTSLHCRGSLLFCCVTTYRSLVPQFDNNVTRNPGQWGEYRYDALSLQLEKRLNSAEVGNFTWVLSYTLSKAMQADHRQNNWNVNEPLVYEIDD